VHDASICLPLAKFTRLVFDRPDLAGQFLAPARRYLEFVEDNVVAKWHVNWQAARGSGENLAEFGGWANLPQNQSLIFGELLLILSDIADSPLYGRDPAAFRSFYSYAPDSMAAMFLRSLTLEPKQNCCRWTHWPVTRPDPRPEDISHANLAVSFCVEAARQKRGFEDSTLARLANTLTAGMWNGSEEVPEFTRFVDGTRTLDESDALFGWLRLNEYSDSLLALVTQAYMAHPDWTAPKSTSSSRALVMALLADAYQQHFGRSPETPPALDEGLPPSLPVTLHASPNPFRRSTALRLSGVPSTVRVYDAAGSLVLSLSPPHSLFPIPHSLVLDLSSLPPGTYFVRAGTDAALQLTALP